MQRIGVYEAKAKLSELLEKVQAGQEITITNHGHPVARLVSAQQSGRDQIRSLIDETRRFRRRVKTGRISLRKIIEEGRR